MAGILCKVCRLQFGTAWLHQSHRVPSAGPVSPNRCLSPDEMITNGWRLLREKWVRRIVTPQRLLSISRAKHIARRVGRPTTISAQF